MPVAARGYATAIGAALVVRHTILVTSKLARREVQLEAARASAHGCQILSPAHVAARLAGGFLQPIDRDSLLKALHHVLQDASIDIGDLASIRDLPGMVRAVAATLMRAWLAGIDLQRRARETGNARFVAVAALEDSILELLPSSMLRPADLIGRALERLEIASRVLGRIDVRSVPDLDPAWRSFVVRLVEFVPVTWHLGQFRPPEWLTDTAITVASQGDSAPEILRVSCANPRHEALEALRWARGLMAGGQARPEQIAIAAPTPQEWDSHLAAIASDASLPLAFIHGRPALATRDGQAAAALAEVLHDGLSQTRVRRALALVRNMSEQTRALPANWHLILNRDAPLLVPEQWRQAIASVETWPEGRNFGAELQAVIDLLGRGTEAAAEVGERLLAGRALGIWRKALNEGPARALDVTLTGIRVEETLDPCTSVLWCSAADIAACPRPYVRLLGLTSRGWPRTQGEDPLLPAHVIDPSELDPVPVPERDRRDFETALRATSRQVVLSRFRRDAEGRQAGESALLRESGIQEEHYLRRERIPEHAVSEADRLLARPEEFAAGARTINAAACWRNWHIPRITPHDGLVRANHPVIERVLQERFSATGLRKLARDPLGFVWRYAFGWDAPVEDEEPLTLDALNFGSLTHRVLHLALLNLEQTGGLAGADAERIAAATSAAVETAAVEYEGSNPVPPRLMWQRTLAEARELTETALAWDEAALPGQRAYAEVPFGEPNEDATGEWPWNPLTPVAIPGTDLFITGRIDRVDIAHDRSVARVTDYKTGRLPRGTIQINGGAELQRCLYAYAVQVLLGSETEVSARLLYPRDSGVLLELDEPRAALARIASYLVAARDHLRAGHVLIGPESGERQDNPLTFALPGNAKDIYIEMKLSAAQEMLTPLPELWGIP